MSVAPDIVMIGRKRLNDRRWSITVEVTHLYPHGPMQYTASFGFDETVRVREVFCRPMKTGSDVDAILSDACIGFSHAMQHGASISQLAEALGQLRPEGAPADGTYPPASALGSIMRMGVEVEILERRTRALGAREENAAQ